MILTIVLALIGAALGAFLRPRPLAVAFAAALSAGSRAGSLFVARLFQEGDGSANWGGDVLNYMDSPFTSYLVIISACAGAALFTALLRPFLREGRSRPLWMPQEGDVRRRDRTGKFIRAAGMVEERAIHSSAEARIRANLER
ncbi:MAG TPA: hypothetical protein VF459_02480 [Caulobacteraceae bacterium]